MSRECPYPECPQRVADTVFACKPHWLALPKPLRDRIWEAWLGGDFDIHRAAKAEAQRYYEDHHRMRKEAISGPA